jgi:hypothetical protein
VRRLAAVLPLVTGMAPEARAAADSVLRSLETAGRSLKTIRFADVVVNGALPGHAFELALPKDVSEVQ